MNNIINIDSRLGSFHLKANFRLVNGIIFCLVHRDPEKRL